MRRAWIPLLALLAVAGCAAHRKPASAPQPRYVLGAPYQADGIWYYPQPSYNAEQTGLAAIYPDAHDGLTANGERFDQTALAAAHQTLQLPAIARLTNLENGRQVLVRINDRGPATPARLTLVTRRTAELLGFPPSGTARIRLEVQPDESHAAVEALGGAPDERLDVSTAPREAVQATELPPPGGRVGSQAGEQPVENAPGVAAISRPAPPLRLPEQVTQAAPQPGQLWIVLGSFGRYEFANQQAAKVSALAPAIERTRVGRNETFTVRIGPPAGVPEADGELQQVIRAGITDARIVVE